jgi:hypothetical protein
MTEKRRMIPGSCHAHALVLRDFVEGAALCISASQPSSNTTTEILEADFGPVNTSLIGD